MNGNNIFIYNSLQNIQAVYESITAFFYQSINQTQYTNNTLNTYEIDYSLLLPSSQFVSNLNENQVNAQLQSYIDLCDELIYYITTTVSTQTNLFLEGIQNTLNLSVSNLNGFALSLLKAQYDIIFTYTPPSDMGMTSVLYINQISLDSYEQQVQLNLGIPDFNNIKQGTPLTLSR